MAYVRTIPPAEAAGALRLVYDRIAEERGGVAAIHQVASLRPDLVGAHFRFYKSLMFAEGGLGRRLRERIAVAVSAANGCRYCEAHHGEALCRLGGAPAGPPADAREAALDAFARKLTQEPTACGAADIEALRAAGLTDPEIVDAVFVASYFNLANRVVSALGVELEPGYTETCR
ncbi:MAG: alkyl hydroperoxide reductase AhpD [Planctomycetota bacterium]|nr:MAG: alkyl hydroperoxide reductase AhpD [Planctomycetota bacterium]